MSGDDCFLRHKHLFTFLNFWDENKDGILSWEDFCLLAERFAKIQRRGKLEKEVFERWKSIFEKWWNELTSYADANKDKVVEFHEWLDFFKKLGTTTKSFEELPEFLKTYLHLFFLCSDANKDGLFCLKDYKKYINQQKMDTSKAEEHFNYMLTEEDKANENALSSDRFKQMVYDYWVSNDSNRYVPEHESSIYIKNANSKGKYIYGPYDLTPQAELEARIKAKP